MNGIATNKEEITGTFRGGFSSKIKFKNYFLKNLKLDMITSKVLFNFYHIHIQIYKKL